MRSRLGLVAAPSDVRFTSALYTVSEAARMLQTPPSTFRRWVSKARLVSYLPAESPREASIPFAGLVEGLVVAALRRPVNGKSASMQYIRKAVAALEQEIGLEHVLASRRLHSDGAKILFDYREAEEDEPLLVETVSKNVVFTQVVQDFLRLVSFDSDDWATGLTLPTPRPGLLTVSPYRGFGQPLLANGAPSRDILARFYAQEEPESIALDFGITPIDVLDVVRAFPPAA